MKIRTLVASVALVVAVGLSMGGCKPNVDLAQATFCEAYPEVCQYVDFDSED